MIKSPVIAFPTENGIYRPAYPGSIALFPRGYFTNPEK